jgi:glycosyltransferase involved in cell wall biosynthesis
VTVALLALLSDIPWETLHQRPHHLAGWLSGRVPVLWVEPATLGRRAHWSVDQLGPALFRLTVPMLPLNAKSTIVRRIARVCGRPGFIRWKVGVVQQYLFRRAVRSLGGGPIMFLVENFQLIHLTRGPGHSAVVFDYIDDAFGFTDYPAFVRDQWVEAVRRADTVIATSPTLAGRIREAVPRDVIVVPNGVECQRFVRNGTGKRPHDLPAGGSIAGYTGSVYPWLDFPLLEEALIAMPDLHFVLVGSAHPEVRPALERLGKYRNFRFVGPKPYADVPAYVQSFDVGIIPFLRNKLTEGVNPVKLYEYLASGVPAVVTEFSDDLKALSGYVFVAGTPEEFVQDLRKAVEAHRNADYRDTLEAFARSNDWDIRFREIAHHLPIPQ